MINNIFKKMETVKDFKDDRIKYREIICPISTLPWILSAACADGSLLLPLKPADC